MGTTEKNIKIPKVKWPQNNRSSAPREARGVFFLGWMEWKSWRGHSARLGVEVDSHCGNSPALL